MKEEPTASAHIQKLWHKEECFQEFSQGHQFHEDTFFLESKVYRNRFDLIFHKSNFFYQYYFNLSITVLFSLKFLSNECILHRTVLFGHKANSI